MRVRVRVRVRESLTPEAALAICRGGAGEESRSWPRKERRRMRAPRRAADHSELRLARSREIALLGLGPGLGLG